jgi:hypothetical protein
MDLVAVGDGVFRGRSLFDGSLSWLTIDSDPQRLLIDYHVGSATERQPRISARVTPGPVCGLPPSQCAMMLTAWRGAAMTDERWQRLCAAHDAEIWLIKAQAETRYRSSGRLPTG